MVQHQTRLPVPHPSENTLLGIPTFLTEPALQTNAFKELVNKIAWAIGSTYKISFSQRRSNVRVVAVALATQIITNEGYPRSISK